MNGVTDINVARIRAVHVFVVPLVLAVFAVLHLHEEWKVAGAFGFPLDDAWIHCQFARNLARGHGMSYNPGVAMSGSTAPLWTFLLAGSYFVSSNLILTSKVMSLVLYALSSVLVFKILVFILDDARFAFLGAVFLAMLARLMWGALSGMEIMLSTFLTVGGVYLHLIYRRERGLKHYASTVAFVLASLARPESMQLVFVALVDSFVLGRIEKSESIAEFAKRAVIHVLVFLLLLTPYFAFNYATSGQPFPNTFAAKTSAGLTVFLSHPQVGELWRMIFLYPRLYVAGLFSFSFDQNILLYWLMFVGATRIVINSFRQKTVNKALIVPLIFVSYPVFMGIVSPNRSTITWMVRYVGNMTPLYVIMGVVGLYECVRLLKTVLAEFWFKEETAERIKHAILSIAVVILLISLSTEEYVNSRFYALGVNNINSMQVKIGKWFHENSPPDTLLAINDIGAIAYFSEREVLDLVGLITPEVLPYRTKQDGIFEFVALKKPAYVIIFDEWFPGLSDHKELTRLFDVSLETNAVCGKSVMVIYETEWRRKRPSTTAEASLQEKEHSF
ncbi:glycosyltransferase family 39 protein [Candidatus Poribacteria bacterium]|nr:glycosyltransferase family 39 protein [Candidatus Poribacteria bacterium]